MKSRGNRNPIGKKSKQIPILNTNFLTRITPITLMKTGRIPSNRRYGLIS